MYNHRSVEPKKNCEAYRDPTAYEAMKNADAEQVKFRKVLDVIYSVCRLAGFHIEERIVLKDLETGKVWR